jgi:hypothetical protein
MRCIIDICSAYFPDHVRRFRAQGAMQLVLRSLSRFRTDRGVCFQGSGAATTLYKGDSKTEAEFVQGSGVELVIAALRRYVVPEKKTASPASAPAPTPASVSTTLTSSVAAGDTVLPVESTVGFSVGATVEIEGGGTSRRG